MASSEQPSLLPTTAGALYDLLIEVASTIHADKIQFRKILPDSRELIVSMYEHTDQKSGYKGNVLEVQIIPTSPGQIGYRSSQYLPLKANPLPETLRYKNGLFEFEIYEGNFHDDPILVVNTDPEMLENVYIQNGNTRLLQEVFDALKGE